MKIGETIVDDTFAEAFAAHFVRLVVTAHDAYWLEVAAGEFAGYASSVIACDAEIGTDVHLPPDLTADGRPGVVLLAFAFSRDGLAQAVANRTGQCLMTCPTTAVFDGLVDAEDRIPLGKHLRFFGDGFQKSKLVGDRRFWRIPVMDGEFLVEESLGTGVGIAGGNVILQAASVEVGLAAARRASAAARQVPGAVTPFPGGVVRSGSKVGSIYKALKASTADGYCPTLRGRVNSKLRQGANCVYEIVVDGVDELAVARAMGAAARAAAGDGIVAISAGNYGGKLGKHHFPLREIVQQTPPGDA